MKAAVFFLELQSEGSLHRDSFFCVGHFSLFLLISRSQSHRNKVLLQSESIFLPKWNRKYQRATHIERASICFVKLLCIQVCVMGYKTYYSVVKSRH